jgi:hypothetical protein
MNCICCEKEIPPERLEAIPGAELCVKCASVINPRQKKLKLTQSIEAADADDEEEESGVSKATQWNEVNDISINTTDEEALKSAVPC